MIGACPQTLNEADHDGYYPFRWPGRTQEDGNVAWKAQVRLSARYRKLIAAGKAAPQVVVAIARELVGFIWAIARMDEPKFA